MKNEDTCPCKSGKTFGECCGPIIAGTARAETAEALMRARYASYVTGDVGFLKSSATKEVQREFNEETSKAWSAAAKWHGLEILRTERGGPGDSDGVVEFRALYTAEQLGIDAAGVSSDQQSYAGATYREVREVLARAKDFFKVLVKAPPVYGGDQIPITGSPEMSHI